MGTVPRHIPLSGKKDLTGFLSRLHRSQVYCPIATISTAINSNSCSLRGGVRGEPPLATELATPGLHIFKFVRETLLHFT